jgi:hypothetical protein
MSDGFKKVKPIFNAEPGKTVLDVPKKKKKPFVSALGKSSKVLNDTVKYSSEVAKRSFNDSVASVQKASRVVGIPQIKLMKRKSKEAEDDTLEKKVERLFDTQDLLFERLDSEPKLSVAMKKSLATIKHTSKRSARYVHRQPLLAKVVTIAAISVLAGGISLMSDGTIPERSINEVAGVASDSTTSPEQPEVRKDPTFEVVTPKNNEVENGSERETPSKDKIFSFVDEIAGVRVVVTQQKLPEVFKKNQEVELAEFAKANYLTSIIQIDESKTYHGLNDKSGIQSFVFIRGGNLVFILADKKLTDETVAAYILALK